MVEPTKTCPQHGQARSGAVWQAQGFGRGMVKTKFTYWTALWTLEPESPHSDDIFAAFD